MSFRYKGLCAVLFLGLNSSPLALAATPAPAGPSLVAPAAPQGWSIGEPPRIFEAPDVFELVDGGGELYLEYGLQRVLSTSYEAGAEDRVQLEIWLMKDSSAASGIYSVMQPDEGEPLPYGAQGIASDYYLSFWKGPCYVTVTGSRPSQIVRKAVRALGSKLANSLGETGEPPALLKKLPVKGLQRWRYFKGPVGLSNIRGFDSLQAFKAKEGIAGDFGDHHCGILSFKDQDTAAQVFSDGIKSLPSATQTPGRTKHRQAYRGILPNGRHYLTEIDGADIFVIEGTEKSTTEPPVFP